MKGRDNTNRIEELLNSNEELTVADFFRAFPGHPSPTVYSKIRALVQSGALYRVGKGRYVAVRKPAFKVEVTEWMLEVNGYMINNCEGVNHCLSQKGSNLFVEVSRPDIPVVIDSLKRHYGKVVTKKEYDHFPVSLEGFIVVGSLISEAPLVELSDCLVPTLEKMLVDSLNASGNDGERLDFQRIFEVYPLNMNSLRRYAARRSVARELDAKIAGLDAERVNLFTSIQKYFSSSRSIVRAWVFGSFARREETPESDIDILVDYAPEAKVSLLEIIRQRLDLEKITGRKVDLVENGYLKPFAFESAERDKYLIYER